MKWQKLERFQDQRVAKLYNLRRACEAGLRVPPTWWLPAQWLLPRKLSPPAELHAGPWIVRSASPTEDTAQSTNAGQFLSLQVQRAADFRKAVEQVRKTLPRNERGRHVGAVFVQPFVQSPEAGVAFFDGFYFERARLRGPNQKLTNGHARGDVERGQMMRGDPWSEWLAAIHRAFGGRMSASRRLDIEYARDEGGYVLLQVRPAPFAVERNYILSLVNHKEVMGDPPSTWIVSATVEAGKDLSFLASCDRTLADWQEVYAVELAERAWANESVWYRWVDHYGLPRELITHTLGGEEDRPEDRRMIWSRFLSSLPRLIAFQAHCLAHLAGVQRKLSKLDRAIDQARQLTELHAQMVAGMRLSIHTNFAIDIFLAPVSEIRRRLRLPGHGRVVTQLMMDEYEAIRHLDTKARDQALDRWLLHYGHRGPLESDPMHPRFAELRDLLLDDLHISGPLSVPAAHKKESPGRRILNRLMRPLYRLDEYREWFRDALMKRWQRIRARVLDEAARLVEQKQLDAVEDVFWLSAQELEKPSAMREAVRARRARVQALKALDLPVTATRDEIGALLQRADLQHAPTGSRSLFRGIPLSSAVIEGRALMARGLTTLLAEIRQHPETIAPDTILVVPALEPSWAVIFPRVAGVVSELGGELSHASILLREVQKPAIVSCTGICGCVHTGSRLRLDGGRGIVALL